MKIINNNYNKYLIIKNNMLPENMIGTSNNFNLISKVMKEVKMTIDNCNTRLLEITRRKRNISNKNRNNNIINKGKEKNRYKMQRKYKENQEKYQ